MSTEGLNNFAPQAANLVKSPLTLAVIRLACFMMRRKSQVVWMLNQNCGLCLKNLPSLSDISGVIERRPSTISLILRGLTPKARPSAFCEPKRSEDGSPRRPNAHRLKVVFEQNLSGSDWRFHQLVRPSRRWARSGASLDAISQMSSVSMPK